MKVNQNEACFSSFFPRWPQRSLTTVSFSQIQQIIVSFYFLFQSAQCTSVVRYVVAPFCSQKASKRRPCVFPGELRLCAPNSAPVFHSVCGSPCSLERGSTPGFARSPATEWKLEAALCKYLNYVIDVSTVIKETAALPLKRSPASRACSAPHTWRPWPCSCVAGAVPLGTVYTPEPPFNTAVWI